MRKAPGFRYKNNKLYAFSCEGVMVLEAWPVLKALRKKEGSVWEAFTPPFRVVKPYRRQKVKEPLPVDLPFDFIPRRPLLADQRRRAFDGFRFSMPKKVANAVEKFRCHQWEVLQFIRHSEGVVDLVGLNPALAFALGNFDALREKHTTMEEAVGISKQRQRDIAGALGFPGTEAAAKILAKISPVYVTVDILLSLREALQREETMKLLSHMPKLNAGVLALTTNPTLLEASTPALLEEVAAAATEKFQSPASEMLRTTLEMLTAIDPAARKPKIQSLAKLRSLHSESIRKFVDLHYCGIGDPYLPDPPLSGTCDIEPIRTTTALVEEGKCQKNCVAVYAERIRGGTTFVYRVLRPERATLSIVKGEDGDWRIDELECRKNTKVSAKTRLAVESWLDQYAISA